jgi:hypothetical protein
MANAIEQIYDQLAQVFGGTNPNQVFSMVMPGTSLDAINYSYDTTKMKPATVQEAESNLTDKMFDIAKVSGSSNGQKVSSQYLQALSVLVPNFNPMMPVLKKTMRDFLNTQMPENTMLDGIPFKGTLQQYYFKLFDNYVAVKLEWETKIVEKKEELSADPATENEKYLEWYEQEAEAYLLKIDEAMAKVLGVFSPSDMDAILGALAAGPGGEINEAANTIRNIQLASQNGGYFYPVNLTPDDWFLDLESDMNPVDLLKDPAFIADTISAKRQALMSSISQVQAMLNDMPMKGDIKTAADALQTAQKAYTDAQNKLLGTYADNTATAVEIYLKKNGSTSSQTDEESKDELDENARNISKAKGENPLAKGATKKNGVPITVEDVHNIVAGQKKLIDAQTTLQTSSQAVADAGLNLASEQASYFGELPVILSRMKAQLADIVNLQNNLGSSIATSGTNTLPDLGPALSDTSIQTAGNALTAANTEAAVSTSTADSVLTKVTAVLSVTDGKTKDAGLQSILDAASNAKNATASAGSVMIALNTAIANLTNDSEIKLAKTILTAAQAESDKPNATGNTVAAIVSSLDTTTNNTLKAACDAAAAVTASANDVLTAVKNEVNKLSRTPVVKKSNASQRFMELQLSFSNSEMDSSSSTDTSFTQTSWSVDLFFGSASGSRSSSSAVTAKNSFDSNTEIKIGLKASKVDIERGWLDPGIFKLSKDMSRLSTVPATAGQMPTIKDADGNTLVDWKNASAIKTINTALFPSFPVAFLVVKDVSITFKATESSLSAIQTVLDSKSAVGGGFLCFSASKSSASHSDHSSISTKTQGTVVNINMPGPQILGWYLELTPQDRSTVLTKDSGTGADELNIIQFVKALEALSGNF